MEEILNTIDSLLAEQGVSASSMLSKMDALKVFIQVTDKLAGENEWYNSSRYEAMRYIIEEDKELFTKLDLFQLCEELDF